MIDNNIIHARIRRSGFKEAAGKFFVDFECAKNLCKEYNMNIEDFLLGVFKDESCWTCVFKEETYFVAETSLQKIENSKLDKILYDFLDAEGKTTDKKHIQIRPGIKIWFADPHVAFAIENLFLLITERQNR